MDAEKIARWVTAAQADALLALETFANIAPWEPSAPLVSERAGKPRYWARDKLLSLSHRYGLCRDRISQCDGVTWRITDLGRAVAVILRKRGEQEGGR